MAEVYGTIGSENVRLRGMALEDTQRRILEAITKQSSKGGIFGDVIEESGKTAGKMAIVSKVFGGTIAVITKAGGLLSDALKNLTGGFSGLEEQIRASDSAIRNSSSNLRILAMNTEGAASKIYRFAAEGISQLEEQFDVYKKLSNIGGVVAGDFDNLRINASTLGVNMQEYAQLMQENFLNLRLGGRSARVAMRDVTNIAQSMRDGGEEFNSQFMRLGIGANDYGKTILENSMLLGGLSEAQKTFGTDFNKNMLRTSKSVTQLGEAFGFNREVVMKAANEAMQDARNRTIFRNIREEGKQQMLALMTGLFGGDAQKGMNATIAAYTGRFDEQSAVLAGMAPELMDKMKALSKSVAGGTDVLTAIKDAGLEPMLARLEKSGLDIAHAFKDNSGAPGVAANALLNLVDIVKDIPALQKNLEASTAGLTDQQGKNLDALGTLQRENIRIAMSMAVANKSLNNFGLSVALGSQIITAAMGEIAQLLAKGGDKVAEELGLTAKNAAEFNRRWTAATRNVAKNGPDALMEIFKDFKELGTFDAEKIMEILKKPPVVTTPTQQQPAGPTAQNTQNGTPQSANGSTQPQTTAPRTTLGPAVSSMLGQIKRLQGARANVPEDQRRDEPLKITYSVDKGTDSSRQVDEIRRLMDQANLKQGVDYKLDSNYDSQKGKIDVQFLSQDAATKFAAAANKIRVAPTAPTVQAPAAAPAAVVSQAGDQQGPTVSTASASSPQVNTQVAQVAPQVNNATANITALLAQNNTWLEKFERIHTDDTTRVINKLESLAQDMRRLTA